MIRVSFRLLPILMGVVAVGYAQAGEAIQYYKGKISLRGETAQEFCLALSTEIVDEMSGNPELSGVGFFYQEITDFHEEGMKPCKSRLELNGNYLRTCSGKFLTFSSLDTFGDGLSGLVFNTLDRFDMDGHLRIDPLGTFSVQSTNSCPAPAP